MNLFVPEYQKWGKTVKKTLIDKEMTITKLSNSIGMARNTVICTLSGKRPSQEAAKRISEYLGIAVP